MDTTKTLEVNTRVLAHGEPGIIEKIRRYKSGVRYMIQWDSGIGTWVRAAYVVPIDKP